MQTAKRNTRGNVMPCLAAGVICILSVGVRGNIAVSGALAPRSSSFDDNFNSPTLNPKWSWVRESPGNWSLTARPGYLHIATEGKDVQSGADTAPLLLQNAPTGDFEISTYVQMKPTADYQQGGIIMYGDDANYIRLTYLFFSTGPVFEFGPEVNGGFTSTKGPLPAGPLAPGYFL